jgi:hypothetical protein
MSMASELPTQHCRFPHTRTVHVVMGIGGPAMIESPHCTSKKITMGTLDRPSEPLAGDASFTGKNSFSVCDNLVARVVGIMHACLSSWSL